VYTEFGRAHNIVINEESGFAYAVGTGSYNGGAHFIDLQDPLNPVAAGGYEMAAYSHDAQVVTYHGPDTEHTGKEILIGSNVNEVVIVDISDKNNPVELSTISYGQIEYTHQGWFTEDHTYFLVGDELDETAFGFATRTIVLDFTDLDNPQLKVEYFGPTPAIDHNGYVKGDRYYLANYTAGMRVLDISDIANGNLLEVGYFDTHTLFDAAAFRGAWNVYPYFESGNIIISDMNYGLFIVKKSS
jgi:choice-of-anchor B domain-containing protein